MHEARKLKEFPRSSIEERDNSPLLYLNVVMEGCESVKLPVYRGDSLRVITEKVRGMMDLEEGGGNGKLERVLKMQILPALAQMGLGDMMQ
jgi:hypothetical protein